MFLDYNQNAKDRTTCSAYSVRPLPDARVSTPLTWEEVPDCDPAEFTMFTVPKRFAEIGDPHAEMDSAPGSLEKLLELAARDEAAGLGDAPWPPHFRKMEGEAPRVAPSRAKSSRSRSRREIKTHARENAVDRDREFTRQSCGAGWPGKMENEVRRSRCITRARGCAGRFDARKIVNLDAHSSQSAKCSGRDSACSRKLPIRMTIRRASGASGGKQEHRKRLVEHALPSGREDCRESPAAEQLPVAHKCSRRLFVGTPSAKLCGMTEAIALHVVISDFDHQLRPKRLPG